MANSIDFRADQIQTKQIIVTGSGAGTTKLLIYGIEAQGSPVNEGLINTTYFPQDGIGGDVFLFVSGAVNTKDSATVRGTSVFGGDLVVSGSLYNGSPAPAPAIRGICSHAEGVSTTASGDYSHAEGESTTASGLCSHAEGQSTTTTAAGDYSHAEGQGSEASGEASHAEGVDTVASNGGSHAEGFSSEASGPYSHAEGQGSEASGEASHAEGYYTKTESTGLYAHAEGYLTTGSGQASHAEGYQTNTLGQASHAEGYQTQTTGAYSHAQGSGSITWGIYSFAAGNRTIASGSVDVTQAAFGRFNKRNNTTSLFVVGNGTGDSDALRGDIFRAESTGQLVLSGGISHKVKSIYYTPISFPLPANDTYNLTLNDYLVIVNVTDGGPFNVYLPPSATTPIGTTYVIRRYDGSPHPYNTVVNIYPDSTDMIIDSSGNDFFSYSPLIIAGSGGRGGCVTLTYIGYYTSASSNYYTWMTTSELDI